MKRLFVLALLAALAGVPGLSGHGAAPKTVDELMKKKLAQSQKVLEGIALHDFDKIARHAEELSLLSSQAEWKVLKTPLYQIYSNEFRGAADDLVKNAKKKNIDAAALSYVELTLTCVKCHKHVREKRMVRAEWGAPAGLGEGDTRLRGR
jgi:hypothetical protein